MRKRVLIGFLTYWLAVWLLVPLAVIRILYLPTWLPSILWFGLFLGMPFFVVPAALTYLGLRFVARHWPEVNVGGKVRLWLLILVPFIAWILFVVFGLTIQPGLAYI